MEVGDKVVHKDYPTIEGRIVQKQKTYLLIVWDRSRPSTFGGRVRTSRHIPSALKSVS
jgi:hypothetical protein